MDGKVFSGGVALYAGPQSSGKPSQYGLSPDSSSVPESGRKFGPRPDTGDRPAWDCRRDAGTAQCCFSTDTHIFVLP